VSKPRYEALILAGGKGTRMGENSNTIPKYLRELKSESLLKRQIRQLNESGFSTATVLVNDRKDMVLKHLTELNSSSLIRLVSDTKYTGTGGAITSALDLNADHLLITYADTVFEIDIQKFIRFHASKNSDFTTLIHPNSHPWDSDRVVVDPEGRVRRLIKKTDTLKEPTPNLCLGGMILVRKTFIEEMYKDFVENKKWHSDLVGDFLTPRRIDSKRVFGYRTSEYIKDAGTPDRFEEVVRDIQSNFSLNSHYRPTVFLDRDGTIVVLKDQLNSPDQVELIPGVARFIRTLNERGVLAIVITNQSVIARGLCSEKELDLIHSRMEELLATNGAYLDQIYYCPHHPDRGFENEVVELKIGCKCRKPRIGLLNRAKKDHKIDTSRTFFVGDTKVDEKTAIQFGSRFFYVKHNKDDTLHMEKRFDEILSEISSYLQ
jgi:mannose-1-phosphate guanylyltransferase/phosphomannomutase